MELTYEEVETIAKSEIEKYSKKAGIPIASFSQFEIASNSQFPWVISCETDRFPKHYLYISIDQFGRIETSRLIEPEFPGLL